MNIEISSVKIKTKKRRDYYGKITRFEESRKEKATKNCQGKESREDKEEAR